MPDTGKMVRCPVIKRKGISRQKKGRYLWEFKPIAYHLQDRTKAIALRRLPGMEERNIKTSAPGGIENQEENKHLKALIDQVQQISRPILKHAIIDYAANHTGQEWIISLN